MLWGEASGTHLQPGSGCPFGVGRAAGLLSSSLIRGGAMLLQQSERES